MCVCGVGVGSVRCEWVCRGSVCVCVCGGAIERLQ